jgi:hypothetical protein
MATFDWWLLIVGLVVGAGLVWLVLADSSRREAEILEDEVPVEAAWISASLADEGVRVDPAVAERMLRLHRTYLASLPPDDVPAPALADGTSPGPDAPGSQPPAEDADPLPGAGVPRSDRDAIGARDR